MLIPHLMFAHMLADYILQSNWMVARKGKSWDGLALHGVVVGFMSLLAVAPYVKTVWLGLVVLTALHTFQDYLKVYLGPRLNIHPFIPYMADQVLHYLTIIGVQVWVGDLEPGPSDAEIAFMWTGAAVVLLTRYYEVTWWANWLDMIPYMRHWRDLGYLERLAMMALATSGLWFAAPLGVVPRLYIAARQKRPIWQQRRGMIEMGLGIALSVVVGLGLRVVYAQI